MEKNEVKWGAIFSYILVAVNAVYGFVLTPYILSKIGTAEYGVYKTISSLSSSLMVLDLGFGGTVMRYIAKYIGDKETEKINPFISMALGEGSIMMAFVALVCGVIFVLLPNIYSSGLSASELGLAKELFLILSLNMLLHIIENIMNGVISGFNRFTFANGIKLIRVIVRILMLYVILIFFKSSVAIVLTDLFLTLLLLIFEIVYIICTLKLKVRLSFGNWDKSVFKESFIYTVLLFLTSIAAQINSNLDNVVVGAIMGSAAVTVYSMGLLIFSAFENISLSISGVMLPTITNVIKNDDGYKKTQALISQVGRIQFILLGAAVVGFAVIGKDFLNLWLGSEYSDVYAIVLILMIPAMLELCVNVCLAVLRAENMLTFRTVILVATTALNAIITIVGVRLYGYFAAAIGTATSFILGSLIIMNIYYNKKLSFNMIRIYRNIFKGTWLCLLISGGALYLSSRFIKGSWLAFLANVLIFSVVYGITLVLFGLNKEEKSQIPIVNKIIG